MSKSAKDRSGLCTFIFDDGRHCNMPHTDGDLRLCYFHEQKEIRRLLSRDAGLKIGRFLAVDIHTACDLNAAFSTLFRAGAEGHIESKMVNSLTRLGQLILQTQALAKDEYLATYDQEWPDVVERSTVFNLDPDGTPHDFVPPDEPTEEFTDELAAEDAPAPAQPTESQSPGTSAPPSSNEGSSGVRVPSTPPLRVGSVSVAESPSADLPNEALPNGKAGFTPTSPHEQSPTVEQASPQPSPAPRQKPSSSGGRGFQPPRYPRESSGASAPEASGSAEEPSPEHHAALDAAPQQQPAPHPPTPETQKPEPPKTENPQPPQPQPAPPNKPDPDDDGPAYYYTYSTPFSRETRQRMKSLPNWYQPRPGSQSLNRRYQRYLRRHSASIDRTTA
jgi:hypothetical protein